MIVLALTVAMLALPISAVYATKPMPVAGTFFPAGLPTFEQRTPGKSDNLFLGIIDGPQMWTGSFAGTAVTNGLWILHKVSDEEAPGYHLTSVQNIFELDVVYDGKVGTLTLKGAHGHWRIMSGTGELANLRGQGTIYLIDLDLMVFGYEGQVHFDP